MDAADPMHQRAGQTFRSIRDQDVVTSNYVLLEASALVDRRLGRAAARSLHDVVVRPLDRVWVDAQLHDAALAAFLADTSGGPSLVDHTSFEIMRARGIVEAFAYDRHFTKHGFELVG